jgi:hypothetical protein
MATSTEFNPTKAFLDSFDAELAKEPEAVWAIGGRASKAYPNGEDERWWREQGPLMVERYMTWRTNTPWRTWMSPDGVLGVELELLSRIGGLRLPTKLYIDRVYDIAPEGEPPRLVIKDVKSGGRPPSGDIQLGVYRCAMLEQWPGLNIVGGCYWMARTGDITPVVNLDHFTPEYIASLMQRLLTARAANVFLPRQSNLCRMCKVGKFCAINNGAEAYRDPDYVLMGRNR